MRIATQVWQRWLSRRPDRAPAPGPRPALAGEGTRFRPLPDVVERRLGDDVFLVHLGRGSVYRLNRTGVAVWELAGQRLSAAEIADRLHETWAVSRDQLGRDVSALLADLLAQDLLEPLSAEAP